MDAECLLDCPVCGQATPAEIPPCSDGHEGGCPDRICRRCEAALFVDPPLRLPVRAEIDRDRDAA